LTKKKKGHTISRPVHQSMARVTIYIPDDVHFRMMKEQEATGLTFSSFCQDAFKVYLRQKRKEREARELKNRQQDEQ
jgi:hypothetical protein